MDISHSNAWTIGSVPSEVWLNFKNHWQNCYCSGYLADVAEQIHGPMEKHSALWKSYTFNNTTKTLKIELESVNFTMLCKLTEKLRIRWIDLVRCGKLTVYLLASNLIHSRILLLTFHTYRSTQSSGKSSEPNHFKFKLRFLPIFSLGSRSWLRFHWFQPGVMQLHKFPYVHAWTQSLSTLKICESV